METPAIDYSETSASPYAIRRFVDLVEMLYRPRVSASRRRSPSSRRRQTLFHFSIYSLEYIDPIND
jgi:hypothetical protein